MLGFKSIVKKEKGVED